jgi:hypothetical protein
MRDLLLVQRIAQLYFQKGDNMGFKLNQDHPYLRPFYLKIYWERK